MIGELESPFDLIPFDLGALRCIGSGTSRVVYDLGDGTVLKVPKSEESAWCNLKEYENWCDVASEHEGMFAPVVQCEGSGLWLIMERAHHSFHDCWRMDCTHLTYPDLDNSGHLDFLSDFYDLQDMHLDNFGIFPDGTVRAIDYVY